jgi:hypothetical protein
VGSVRTEQEDEMSTHDWTRYTEVTLTDDEIAQVDDYGLPLSRDGQEIHLLAQTDESAIYGIEAEDGDLAVADAGCLYQGRTDWQDLVWSLADRYHATVYPDTYVQSAVVRLPYDDAEADTLLRLLAAVTALCRAEYAEYNAH